MPENNQFLTLLEQEKHWAAICADIRANGIRGVIRPVDGFEGYFVSTDGRVLSSRVPSRGTADGSLKELRPNDTGHGYFSVALSIDGKVKRRYVHQLVAEAFIGARPEGYEVRHLNGRRSDNRVENMTWGTRVEQQADCERHGTRTRGSRTGTARLSEASVAEIKQRLGAGESLSAVARAFSVSVTAIWRIAHGKGWRHVNG